MHRTACARILTACSRRPKHLSKQTSRDAWCHTWNKPLLQKSGVNITYHGTILKTHVKEQQNILFGKVLNMCLSASQQGCFNSVRAYKGKLPTLFPVDALIPCLAATQHPTDENQKDLKLNVWVQQHQKPQMLSSARQHHEWRTKQRAVSQCVCVCMPYTPV